MSGTILNDDSATLSIDDVSAVEGDGGSTIFTFTVTLDNEVDTGLSVDFATTDDTATTADTDYTGTSGTLNFLGTAGETQTLSVSVTGDTKVELDETFLVDLSNVSANGRSVFLGDGQGVGTILNDDSASLSIDDVSAVEGNAGTTIFAFTVTLDGAVDTGLSVDFATADDTATTGDSDYAATFGTLNFAGTAGETQTLSVSVNGDTKVELDETFLVDLSNISAGGRSVFLGDGQGIGTILNDDSASLSIDDVSAVEGDAGHDDLHVHRHARWRGRYRAIRRFRDHR